METPWIKTESSPTFAFICTICGSRESFATPAPLDKFLKRMRAFMRTHAACGPSTSKS